MSFGRYPAYKDSGVEWLGEVPESWRCVPVKHIGRLKGGAAFPHECQGDEAQELPFHKVNAIGQAGSDGTLRQSGNTVSRDIARKLGAFIFPRDSVVFAKVGAALLLGRIRMLDRDSCIDNNMMGLVVGSTHFDVRFVIYAMNLVRFDFIANPGTVPSLNESQIGDFRLAVPSLSEQTRIAAFLDRETAKIDGLVAEQQRLIELLKEKRQAVISHAVTKGLNPAAPMKPSSIEWLGDVPAHWNATPLQWITDPSRPIMYGIVLPGPDVGNGIPILKGGNVKPARMNLESMARTTPEIEAPYARARLKNGDLVYAIRGTIGDCEFVPPEMTGVNITQDVARVSVSSHNHAAWVRWALLASPIRDSLECGSLGAAVRGVNIGDLKKIKLPRPPIDEQIEIASHLNTEVAKNELLAAEAQRAIDLLQERRTALIAAAVTGQIDVRHLAEAGAA